MKQIPPNASTPQPQGVDAGAAVTAPGSGTEQVGIQSLEVGMRLLTALAELTSDAAPPMLKTLAMAAGMPPAKAHRYVVSFLRSGYAERDPVSGRLRLGPVARRIGIAAIRNNDVIKLGAARLPQLCADLGHSVALAIWAYPGATIVATEDMRQPVTIGTRVGEIMPLLASATGRVFGAWLPEPITRPHVEAELQRAPHKGQKASLRSYAQARRLFQDTRKAGLGCTLGGVNATVNALSAPVFDFRGEFVAALSTLGPAVTFDASLEGPTAKCLRDAAAALSRELGSVV